MRALQITSPGTAEIVVVPQPAPGPGEVLVRVFSCTLCNQHDVNTFYGRYRRFRDGGFPRPAGQPGHEGSGVVAAVGQGVTAACVGDRVALAGGTGLYAEYVLRKADEVVPIAPHVTLDEAAPLELAACVLNAVRMAEPLGSRCAAVFGLGPAGLMAVQLLRIAGARDVWGADPLPIRCQAAVELGASTAVHPEDIQRLPRPDVVVDCSGDAQSVRTAFETASELVVLFGYTEEPITVDQEVWFRSELTIRNARMLGRAGIENLRTAANYLAEGRLNTRRLITHRLPLEQYSHAVQLAERRECLKAVIHVIPHQPSE
ncbi:MAG: zinc-dependent alcohol dehydrogenase [Armatimonadota bacterium]